MPRDATYFFMRHRHLWRLFGPVLAGIAIGLAIQVHPFLAVAEPLTSEFVAAAVGAGLAVLGAILVHHWQESAKTAEVKRTVRIIYESVLRDIKVAQQRIGPEMTIEGARDELHRMYWVCDVAIERTKMLAPDYGRLGSIGLQLIFDFEYAAIGNKRIDEDHPEAAPYRLQHLKSLIRIIEGPARLIVKIF